MFGASSPQSLQPQKGENSCDMKVENHVHVHFTAVNPNVRVENDVQNISVPS